MPTTLKRKYTFWTAEELGNLKTFANQHASLSGVAIARLYIEQNLTTRELEAIKRKLYSACISKKTQPTATELYLKEIKDMPINPCAFCHRLMFQKGLQILNSRMEGNESFVHICQACKRSSRKVGGGLLEKLVAKGFNDQVDVVASLNNVELRLISIRIPFAQIRELSHKGQYGLRGSIVNVLADTSRMQKILPRFCDLEASVMVGIKRKLIYDHSYLSGVVRPLLIMCALTALLKTPLYHNNNVALNEDWLFHVQALQSTMLPDSSYTRAPEEDDDEDEVPSDYLLHNFASSQQVVDLNDSIINIAPCEGFQPLSLFKDKHCEELGFPSLFFGHERKYASVCERDYQTVAKWELLNKDRRFANAIENLFFKTVKIMVAKVLSSIWVRLRKAKVNACSLTVESVLRDTAIENILASKIGYKDFQALRTSPDYKEKLKANAFAMIRQLGTPTFFVTFSAAERLWPELLESLERLNHKQQAAEETLPAYRHRLIRNDPITCVRYYVHRFQALKKLLLVDNTIIGRLLDYFFVTEFQTRGSQHDHGLLWIENAPILDLNADEEIATFVDRHVTTNVLLLPEMLQAAQTHHHTKTCYKRGKQCRFNFPRPPMLNTTLLRPLTSHCTLPKPIKKRIKEALQSSIVVVESFDQWLAHLKIDNIQYMEYLRSTISTPTLYIQREPKDIFTNNFNPKISSLWNANTDIQFIMNAHGAASYCTSYMTKVDNTLTRALKQQFQTCMVENASTIERLKKMGSTLLHTQQLSAQQAVYICLSLPLSSSSREFQFINSAESGNRTLLLKKRHILEGLPANSSDIFCPDIIRKYAERNTCLSNICLADFVALYNSTSKKTTLRKKTRIIKYIKYNKSRDPENFYREQCLLFLPFIANETYHLHHNETWHDVYDRNAHLIATNMKKYNKILLSPALAESISHVASSSDTTSNNTRMDTHNYDLSLDITSKSKNNHPQYKFVKTYIFMENNQFFDEVRKLNTEQRSIFDDIMLKKRLFPHKQIHLFLTGGAGTGKTFTLLLVVQALLRFYSSSTETDPTMPLALLTAYTGKAAFNIGGTTIHSALHLPLLVNTSNGLSSEKLDVLSSHYRNLRLIVIDEISLVGSKTFHLADSRLRSIMHMPNKPFGGLDVILCGDLFQVSPVKDSWVFKPQTGLLETLNPSYWRNTLRTFELHQTMRQNNTTYIRTLNKIRVGSQTDEDLHYLNSSFFRFLPEANNIPHLFYTNEDKNKHNEVVYNESGGTPHTFLATDTRHQGCSRKIHMPIDPQHTGGLHHTLHLKPGIVVELCAGNHDILDGLVNGADGKFMGTNTNSNANTIWLQFSTPTIGQRTRYESKHLYTHEIPTEWTPIHTTTKEFQIGKNSFNIVTRKQFPIQPASARTIHRSQGLTMASLAFNPKKIRGHGLVYTALSRVKDPSNLFLLDKITHSHIKVDASVLTESQRLQNEQQWLLENKDIQTISSSHTIVQSLNTVSLNKHHANIIADRTLMASHILCLQETRTNGNNPIHIPNFQTLNAQTTHGLALYYKPTLQLISWQYHQIKDIELMTAHFKDHNSTSLQITNIYKPPTTSISNLLSALRQTSQELPTTTISIYVGDFNIDAIKQTPTYKQLETFFAINSIQQQIHQPTTIHRTTIDHIWTTKHCADATFGTKYCYWSDHSSTYIFLPHSIFTT